MPEVERLRRVRELFDRVAAEPEAERASRLAALCPDDSGLQDEVAALLAAETEASRFLDGLARAAAGAPSLLGRQLGPYRIEEKLGEGGMSTVYRAVRTDLSYQGEVAIKVFACGPDRADLALRFQAERQILASLRHPAIARLLDGGSTEEGLPYLVMERIEGEPVDRYCDLHRLSTDARIDLFLRICEAVSFAHRNLIVHRDLKPANILVEEDGAPKLLDFGIAKLLAGARLPLEPQATRTGQRLLTPQYASPEQLTGGPITTATDVYALGVLLYLLLAGRLPYRIEGERPGELERAILELPPERPSQGAPPRLRRALAGDLDNIVLRALRKEPGERYPSVDLLAEDLRRHRQGLPVAARPATLAYRLRKFVGRNRLAVALGSATFLVILGLAISMTFLSLRLKRERDRAVEVTSFLEEVFRGADVAEGHGGEVTARELLDRGGARVLEELSGQPETQGALTLAIGRAYASLGLYEPAARFLERSLVLSRQVFGERSSEVAACLDSLADLDLGRGEVDAAETAARRALAIHEGLRGRLHEGEEAAMAESLNLLGLVHLYRDEPAAAEPLFRRSLAINRRAHGEANGRNAEVLGNLAVSLRLKGDLAGAAGLYRQAIALESRSPGPYPTSSVLRSNLGVVLVQLGDLAGAEAAFREALAAARKLYGAEHPSIALQLNNLASVLVDRGDLDTAEAMYRQALAMQRKLLGNDHEHVGATLNNLADLESMRGNEVEARQLYEEALASARRLFGPEHPRVADQLVNLAGQEAEMGDPAGAEPLAREALAIRRKRLGEAHPDTGSALVALGGIRQARGAPAEAETLLTQGLAVLRAALPPDHPSIANAESRLGACLAARGRGGDGERLMVSGYRSLERKLGAKHPKTVAARKRLEAFQRSRRER